MGESSSIRKIDLTGARVLVVDDHALFRAGLRSLLVHEYGVNVVAEAENGRDAIHATARCSPNLVLMDLTMPSANGVEATQEIKRRFPDVRVLVVTQHAAQDFVLASLMAGADGYIVKSAIVDELILAMHEVMAGRQYICAEVRSHVTEGFMGGRW